MTDRELLELLLQKVTSIETEQKSMKQELQDVKSQMNSRFDTADTKMSLIQTDVTEIKASVHRIDADQPEDVIGLLKSMNEKLENRDNEMLAVNRRLYRVEGAMEGLTKQN